MEAGGDRAVGVTHEEGELPPVVETGLLNVVEIELILEEPDVFRPWLRFGGAVAPIRREGWECPYRGSGAMLDERARPPQGRERRWRDAGL